MWKFSSILLLWIAKLSVVFILFVSIGMTEGKIIGKKFVIFEMSLLKNSVNFLFRNHEYVLTFLTPKLNI